MPGNADAVRFCRQCFTSFTREMPGNADAVRFGRQRFTSFMREMPGNADAVIMAMLRSDEMTLFGLYYSTQDLHLQ
jgi:hypothetical protein